MDNEQPLLNNLRKFFPLIILVGLGLLILIGLSVVRRLGKVQADFLTAPKEAVVMIGNSKVGSSIYLSPGKYDLTVSHDGFTPYKQTFEIKKGDSKMNFSVGLTPVTEAARKLANSEVSLYARVEAEGSKKAQQAGLEFTKNYPLVRNLPYDAGYYRIDYGKDSTGALVIQISSDSGALGRQVALEKIRSWGYDPTDYIIVFPGLNNPFTSDGSARTD